MDGYSYFCEIKKHSTQKKLFPATKRSNFFLGATTFNRSLFLWAAISLEFLYIYQ